MSKNKTPRFTKKQTDAIYTRDKNILVSAGAGSGKTTVLTKRLIERIKSGDSVTDFLVVTFMKAAASDIKSKLYEALLEETAKDPNNTHVYRQSLLVSEADICTISSYCLSLVKENFALLGISPKVRVIDETEADMLLRRVADELIAEGYNNSDMSFLQMADNFTGDKNDTPLADSMIKLYNTLRVTLGRESVLINCAERLVNEAECIRNNGFFACDTGRAIRDRLKQRYAELIANAADIYEYAVNVATEDSYIEPFDKLITACENIYKSLDTNYVNFISTTETAFSSIRLSSKGCEKEDRELLKSMKEKLIDEHNKIKKRYIRGNDEYNANSFEQCANIVIAVNAFLNELEVRYESIKRDLGVLDYTDFEQKALELLETTNENGESVPTELCLKKQKQFKEILIDEYQDVNPMQDRIFCLLAGQSKRFMVGDVKQSIYRFRNAYPDIFLDYKDEYADIDSDKSAESVKIFLRENFRCGENVINYVNFLFESVTKDTEYFREYDGEWLIKAADRPDMKHPVVVAVADKEKGKAKEARRAEAEYIAKEISRLITDGRADDGSRFTFSDFAVMLGAMKGYSIEYEKAFAKFGIPYKTEISESFLENPTIRLAVSALKAIDDPTDDISLCALMRSPICSFSSDELYNIRKIESDCSFFVSLSEYADNGADAELASKSKSFLDRLTEWRSESAGVPCRDFLKSFFVSSGLLRIAAGSGQRESVLLLYDYADRYETPQNQGLSGFIDYLGELSKGERQISDAARVGDSDAVSFITVHKSKGLEYKVCFLAGTEKQFRGMRSSSEITVLRGEGIYFRLRDRVNFTSFDPLCNINAADRERDSAYGEELRKLYVALTRAKERLYITGSADIGWREKRYLKSASKSWLDMVLYSLLGNEGLEFVTLLPINETEGRGGYLLKQKRKMIAPTAEMIDMINFKYPYANAVKTAAKISVSELREGLLEDDEYNRVLSIPESRVSMKPCFVKESVVSATDIGTANHLFMQFCNFDNVENKGVEWEAKRLLDIAMISNEQFKMLNFKALSRFFESRLYCDIRASRRVYREKRFSISDYDSQSGERILVQGVIDCFFENPDGSYTVVDYKTDRVKTPEELIERHKSQVGYYCNAVERMTGNDVKSAVLYSFELGIEVNVK